MASMSLMLVFLFFIGLSHYQVQGWKAVTGEKDSTFERQLKILNKLAHKTVKTKEGDIIDCIEIYKQPTLDHPLLKNHKVQMRPTSLPQRVSEKTISTTKSKVSMMISKNINCPKGTVPIRRTQKEDLIRAESFNAMIHPLTQTTPGRHQAIIRSSFSTNIVYKGIEATISIYNPTVYSNQSSFAQIWIEGGPSFTRNSLQTGWMVSPDLYGDNRTRSFIYFTMQGAKGCFNYLCAGFVQVNSKFHLGGRIRVSDYDSDTQFNVNKMIFQDRDTGNWWLLQASNNEYIGYWPYILFPWIGNGASQVVWGGQVLGHSNGASPEMGNGILPNGNYRQAAYVTNMYVVDTNNVVVEPLGPEYGLESFVDNTNCYKLDDFGYKSNNDRLSFLFGGPGGDNCGI